MTLEVRRVVTGRDAAGGAIVASGDVVVQRGTMHAWVNNGTQPCVLAFVLIDAHPANVDGQSPRTHYSA